MTAPVFEHTEVGGSALTPRMAAFMDNLDRRWRFEDAINAHGEVEDFVTRTIEEVGVGVAFLDDGDTLGPDTLDNWLQVVIDDYASRATNANAKQDVVDARRALDSAKRCYEVLRTLVDNVSDPMLLDKVGMAVEKLTPTEGEP